VDLATSDPEGARRFYGELFGWEFQVGPADTGHYITCLVGGRPVAGITGEPVPAGTPAAWTTYLASGDVDDTAGRVRAAGGRVTADPADVMAEGRNRTSPETRRALPPFNEAEAPHHRLGTASLTSSDPAPMTQIGMICVATARVTDAGSC
jgi:predicted enzyme related to lactoylglutathione lyase